MKTFTIRSDGPDGRVDHFYADTDLQELEVVPKTLADELAACLAIYDEADHLPHGRVTNAVNAYREATGQAFRPGGPTP